MSRPHRVRPTLADLEKPGPAISPADLAVILGVSRELVGAMCRAQEIQALHLGLGSKLHHWKIPRAVALAYCKKNRVDKVA